MKTFFRYLVTSILIVFVMSVGVAKAQDSSSAADQAAQQHATNTQAAAAVAGGYVQTGAPDYIEELMDSILGLFDVNTSGNTWQRYVAAAVILIIFYLLRRVVLRMVFGFLRRIFSHTALTLDNKLLNAVESPISTLMILFGLYVAVRTLKYEDAVGHVLGVAATIAFALTFMWLMVRILGTIMDHLQEKAVEKKSSAASFIPWMKKGMIGIVCVIGILMLIQSQGYDVKAILAGLGIGGLAFALAAQDTIANLFGAFVVAVDQPFRQGEVVQIGSNVGMVEDIGMRSIKMRKSDKSLVVIPNKTVAGETITNLSRFTNRRVEQVLGFTYDSTPEQLDTMSNDIRAMLTAEEEIEPASVMVYFRDFSACSLDLWVVYLTKDPDFGKMMRLRQRLNLAYMCMATERGLSFAFPTQTIDFGSSAAKVLSAREKS